MTDYHPVVSRIKEFLDTHNISYKTFEHEAVRTSEEAAVVRPEYPLSAGAKALIIRVKQKGVPAGAEKQFVQIVVPGDAKFDVKKAKAVLHAKDIRFATETEVHEITNGVQPGGVPPFGNLFGVRVIVDESVFLNEEIIFNAGDRRYSIAIKSHDYQQVVAPEVVSIQ